MGKGTNTTTTSSSPNPQAGQAYSDLLNRAASVASTPYQAYNSELVAPVNSQQFAGIGGINANANYAQPFINQAAGYATQAAAPITGQQINQYLSPYTQDVVNATEAQFNQQNAQQQSQLTGNAAAQGALGGDRVGVAQGTLAGQQQLAEAPVIAGLENQGYSTALQTALAEQQNLGNAAYSLGNLGISGQNAALSGATAQIGAGGLEQQTQQAQDQALYQQFLNQQAFPYQQTQYLAGLDTAVGSQMGGTSSTTGPAPNMLGQFLGLGLAGLSLSDRRAKRNVSRVGETDDGQPLYRYQYKGGDEWHIGPMAQEVERSHPDAVHRGLGGLKFVDLKSATDDAATPRKGLDTGGGIFGGGGLYAGGTSYIPSISLTAGKGAPAPPSLPQQQQTNPLQMLKDASTVKNAFGGKGGGLGGLFGGSSSFGGFDYGDPGTAAAAQAGVDSGLSFDALTGDVFKRGGGVRRPRVAGFGTGGFVRPHFDDGGALMPIMLPDSGDSFNDRYGGYRDFSTPSDLSSAGVNDIPSAPSPGLVPDQAIPLPRARPEYAPAGGDDYINPPSVNGQPQNLTGEIIPPGGFGGAPAPDLGAPVEVADTRPAGLTAYADERPSSPVAGLGAAAPASSEPSRGGFGWNPFGLSDNARTAMLAAGLGMMASRSPFLGNVVGEGGLQGLSTYSGLNKQDEEKKKTEASIEQGRQKLDLAAKQAQQHLDLQTKQLELAEKKLDVGHFTPVPSIGIDPATGRQTQGTRVFDTKTGQSTFQPWVQTGKQGAGAAANLPPEAWNAHGDEFLGYLPPQDRQFIKKVANYDIDPKTFSTRGGSREDALKEASQYDPSFDQKIYNERFNAVNRFATGTQGQTVKSLNVAIDHLGTLSGLTDALNNGNVRAVNQIGNWVQTELGKPAPTNFNSAKQIVADEVLKAVLGTGAGTQLDREQLQAQLSAANSPAQLKGAIQIAERLMAGQVVGLRQQYEGSTGLKDFDQRWLTPAAREHLSGLGQPAGGGAPAGGRAAIDQQALAWANANPNDPRAAEIKRRLGVQ